MRGTGSGLDRTAYIRHCALAPVLIVVAADWWMWGALAEINELMLRLRLRPFYHLV